MPCLTQIELIDLAVVQARSGGPDAQTCDHLKSCLRCSQGLSEYRDVLSLFGAAVISHPYDSTGRPCLDDEEISAFVDGGTSQGKREDMERHLVHCSSCFGQVVELTKLLQKVDTARGSLLTYLIGMAKNGLTLLRRPTEGFQELRLEPAILLGSATELHDARPMVSWNQEYGEYKLTFTLTQADESHVDLRLRASYESEPVREGRVVLRQLSNIVQSEGLSTSGEVALRNLEEGTYTLEIRSIQGAPTALTCDLALCGSHEE